MLFKTRNQADHLLKHAINLSAIQMIVTWPLDWGSTRCSDLVVRCWIKEMSGIHLTAIYVGLANYSLVNAPTVGTVLWEQQRCWATLYVSVQGFKKHEHLYTIKHGILSLSLLQAGKEIIGNCAGIHQWCEQGWHSSYCLAGVKINNLQPDGVAIACFSREKNCQQSWKIL